MCERGGVEWRGEEKRREESSEVRGTEVIVVGYIHRSGGEGERGMKERKALGLFLLCRL